MIVSCHSGVVIGNLSSIVGTWNEAVCLNSLGDNSCTERRHWLDEWKRQ